VAAIRWTHSQSLGAIRVRFTSPDLTPKAAARPTWLGSAP